MKLRLNKATISQMPQQVRDIVVAWKERYHKTTISVENRPDFYVSEDACYTAINLMDGRTMQARATGEWAGITNLSPCAKVSIPEGCVMVEQAFFMGVPYLTIFQGGKTQVAA